MASQLSQTSENLTRLMEEKEEEAHKAASSHMHFNGRDWSSGLPTTNPHCLYALSMTDTSPWDAYKLPVGWPHSFFSFAPHTHTQQHLQTPFQLSAGLENVYTTKSSVHAQVLFQPKPKDIVVTGLYRSGQTPVLQILASLKAGKYINKKELLEHTDWIEAAFKPSPPLVTAEHGGRLLKTHLPVRTVCGGVLKRESLLGGRDPHFRVIVCLRDPNDLRLSWFRHVRRVYQKFHPTQTKFDYFSKIEDWATFKMYCSNPHQSSRFDQNLNYEDFLFDCLADQRCNPKQVLLVFYEELLLDPLKFVETLAKFVQLDARTRISPESIVEHLVKEPEFPRHYHGVEEPSHRNGSSGQGRLLFSPMSLRKNEANWKLLCSTRGFYESYEETVFQLSEIVIRPPVTVHPRRRFFTRTPAHSLISEDSETDDTQVEMKLLFHTNSAFPTEPLRKRSTLTERLSSLSLRLLSRKSTAEEILPPQETETKNLVVDPDESDDEELSVFMHKV